MVLDLNAFFVHTAMLFYRMMTCCRKIYVKLLHTVFHALSIACIAIGFLTVWDSHELVTPKIPHFYSLHSWLGLTTMGLFAIQVVLQIFYNVGHDLYEFFSHLPFSSLSDSSAF